ncbi:hypothetical protein IGI04_004593 [Brassica rapa subsp. trilocularis]|uniref:Reverse transcriptase zinc-binding domain-containing protein n=1 Tax=Brassica rapa subsp. trilocularis TaxID=1813537 RepID=A0ABQ7NBK4_BRACM|nr:hypothetical protein IGI04_004593 [Brassica rapa subsp. trilocularis]
MEIAEFENLHWQGFSCLSCSKTTAVDRQVRDSLLSIPPSPRYRIIMWKMFLLSLKTIASTTMALAGILNF